MATLNWDAKGNRLFSVLRASGIELDQRMRQAVTLALRFEAADDGMSVGDYVKGVVGIRDLSLIYGLHRLNTKGIDYLPSNIFSNWLGPHKELDSDAELKGLDVEDVKILSATTRRIFAAAASLSDGATLTAARFIQAVFQFSGAYDNRAYTMDALAKYLTGERNAPVEGGAVMRRIRDALSSTDRPADDFDYALTVSEKGISFRIMTVLGDFTEEGATGLLIPERCLLTHSDKLGFFTQDVINELEILLNSPLATESDFQVFFERNPQFLRRWDHREVFPQVYLTREGLGPLIPDFILTNKEVQEAALVELKSPRPRIVNHQRNRVRFSSLISEARSQLLTYQRWFESDANRLCLKERIGMNIYRPRLMVIVGRSSEFQDEIERQTLRADNSDLDVVTYDDMLSYARRRRLFIESGRGGTSWP